MIRVVNKLLKKLWPKKFELRQNVSAPNEAYCPVCHSTFASFAPFGSPERKNARCPKCGSLERHRLLCSYLESKTDLFANRKIKLLHFAPEKFFYDKFIAMSRVEYMACDISPELYKFDKQQKIKKVDITAIPCNDSSIDVILCNHVLEHIPDDHKAMSELFRVLKPNGWGIFQVPIDYDREKTYEDFSITTDEGRAAAFGQNDHVRWYGRDYSNRLRTVGFNVKEDGYVGNFSNSDLHRYGFMKNEIIYFVSK